MSKAVVASGHADSSAAPWNDNGGASVVALGHADSSASLRNDNKEEPRNDTQETLRNETNLKNLPGKSAAWALRFCARVAGCTDVTGTITRLFLSPAARPVHALFLEEMERLGMAVRVDAAGNVRGMYAAAGGGVERVLLVGSHVDTVPDAGAYDGVLGVAVALAVVRGLGGRRLPFAVEVIAFSEEEGLRFRLPFLGSRALVGTLDAEVLARRDADGITVADAIRGFGLDVGRLEDAEMSPGTVGFVECHIEQGPLLEARGLALGVVEAIAGQTRLELTFAGEANHAGTTPMGYRRDALMAAAEWMVWVEQTARVWPGEGLRATVGRIEASPGAANVIPGTVVLTLDVRHAEDVARLDAVRRMLEAAERIAGERGVTVSAMEMSAQASTPMDAGLVGMLGEACAAAGYEAPRMVSGAGHDAMVLAQRVPSAMLFVRTPRGLSHHPEESVREADVQAACDVLTMLLERMSVEMSDGDALEVRG